MLDAGDGGVLPDTIPTPDGPSVDGPPVVDQGGECPLGSSSCVDETHQKVCKTVAGKAAWVTEACQAGTLCLGSACSAECTDECNLDETRTTGGQTETCKPFSVAQNATVPITTGLHDRARKYNAWLRKHHLPGGTVSDTYFADATHSQVVAYHGTGDSAIWTGSYLAAEALRLMETGSPDAEANVQKMVEAIHRLFEVNGHTGYLSRFTAPLNTDPLLTAIYDPSDPRCHQITYNGQSYFWKGDTSRDQYQGVLLGYALAYQALSSASHKKLIRDDMVALCTELLKDRKQVDIKIKIYVLNQWLEQIVPVDLQYVVLNPTEYEPGLPGTPGTPYIQIGSDADPSAYEESTMRGFREFFPDYATILKQMPIIGPLITIPIPRSGSAIMLASIMRIGLLVTENEPGYASTYTLIKNHYDQNIQSWLDIMKLYYNFNNASQCWKSYYGMNIVFQPMYNLARLEDDLVLKTAFQKDVLEGKMWPNVKDHKNVFFSYIHASQATLDPTVQQVINDASDQLAQFPPPPHAKYAVDNTTKTNPDGSLKYPPDSYCAGHSTVAIDVADRIADDFIWQRDPFGLSTPGDPKKVYPGGDYLLAYWMGRHHKFLTDDGAGTCLRWRP
jgi:hypothetical protein